MTTPNAVCKMLTRERYMTARPSETLVEKHTRLAWKTLADAEREIEAGDYPQAAEKLWGAASHAMKAYCASHGLLHSKYQHRRRAMMDLAEHSGNTVFRAGLNIADSCHSNFYNDWMERQNLDICLPDIQQFVKTVLEARAE